MPPTPATPLEVYCIFCGIIDQAAVQRIFQTLVTATNPANNVKHIHLLFQSSGGNVGDGVCLYNFFKSLPVDLTLYNAGSVSSIAVIAYLGAEKRKTSTRATFVIHRSHVSPQFATATRLQSFAESLTVEDQRTESILREHIKLPDEKWSDFTNQELFFSGEEAVKIGLADEVGEFSPPKGTQIFNI